MKSSGMMVEGKKKHIIDMGLGIQSRSRGAGNENGQG